MLHGLSPLELARVRMSVGYGGHRKGRPLSPVEVAVSLRKARKCGASLTDCAEAVQLHDTSVSRFLRILNLPADLQHLIDWGSGKNFIGFSTAVETTKLKDPTDQRAVAAAALENNLHSKEVRQVTQLRERSGRSIDECVQDVLDMRPKVVKRYVFIGSVAPENANDLRQITQSIRDSVLAASLEKVGLVSATGRLGIRFFTLVGDELFNASMQQVGKENVESQLRVHISQGIVDAAPGR